MNRPDLETIRKLAEHRSYSTRTAILELLAYIAELENLVSIAGDEWETGFNPPLALRDALRILRTQVRKQP